jgi:hypothetical protein
MEFVLMISYSVQFILFRLEGFQNMDYHYFSSIMISTYFPYSMALFIPHYGHEILVTVLIIISYLILMNSLPYQKILHGRNLDPSLITAHPALFLMKVLLFIILIEISFILINPHCYII